MIQLLSIITHIIKANTYFGSSEEIIKILNLKFAILLEYQNILFLLKVTL